MGDLPKYYRTCSKVPKNKNKYIIIKIGGEDRKLHMVPSVSHCLGRIFWKKASEIK